MGIDKAYLMPYNDNAFYIIKMFFHFSSTFIHTHILVAERFTQNLFFLYLWQYCNNFAKISLFILKKLCEWI